MPKVPKQTVHARVLRELGFKPYNELLSPEDMAEIDADIEAIAGTLPSKLPRAQRRQLVAKKVLPGFLHVVDRGSPFTFVADELGNEWHADSIIDLEPFGFHNGLEGIKVREVVRKKRLN
jgi:hypothetical protein